MAAGWTWLECQRSHGLRLRHLTVATKLLHRVTVLHEGSTWIRCLSAESLRWRMQGGALQVSVATWEGGRLLRYDFGTSQLRGAIGLSRGLLCVDQDQQGYRLTHLASCRACCPVSCDSIVGTV